MLASDRAEVRPFTDKQIELVTTFADQAVIAIENVRLFDELQARTRELAQSVSELHALGEAQAAVNSTLDLQTVLDTSSQGSAASRHRRGGDLRRIDNYPFGKFQLTRGVRMSHDVNAEFVDDGENTAFGRGLLE